MAATSIIIVGTLARSLASLYSTGADPAGVENAEGALAACRRHHLANRAIVRYSTDEMPLSAIPIPGKTARPAVRGTGSNAKIPSRSGFR